jgi:hypothetical protein
MGQIQPYTDLTGKMSPEEINAENTAALMQEWNRGQDVSPLQLSLFSDGTTNRYEIGYLTNGWGTGKNVGVKASKQGVEVSTATDVGLTYKDDFTTKTWYDNTVPRILEGLLPDGSYGMWVSKPGVDVTTANSSGLIFNSNQDTFKIVQTATVTIPGVGSVQPGGASGYQHITVNHNLGYIPAFSAYAVIPLDPSAGLPISTWNQAFPAGGNDANGVFYNLQCGTDINNIYFTDFWSTSFGRPAAIQSFSVTYYLFTTTA